MKYLSEDHIANIVSQIKMQIDFDEIGAVSKAYHKDPKIALPQVDSRSLKLQTIGYPLFVREWFRHFDGVGKLSETECDELLARISDWRSINMVTYVCRMHLRDETPISWRKVAERAYDSRKNSFPKLINEKMKASGEAFNRLGVFEIETSFRIVGGLPEVSRYFVSAGFTLKAFERHIWRELRLKQLKRFYEEHLVGL